MKAVGVILAAFAVFAFAQGEDEASVYGYVNTFLNWKSSEFCQLLKLDKPTSV